MMLQNNVLMMFSSDKKTTDKVSSHGVAASHSPGSARLGIHSRPFTNYVTHIVCRRYIFSVNVFQSLRFLAGPDFDVMGRLPTLPKP